VFTSGTSSEVLRALAEVKSTLTWAVAGVGVVLVSVVPLEVALVPPLEGADEACSPPQPLNKMTTRARETRIPVRMAYSPRRSGRPGEVAPW
jgi:hypothetical protein